MPSFTLKVTCNISFNTATPFGRNQYSAQLAEAESEPIKFAYKMSHNNQQFKLRLPGILPIEAMLLTTMKFHLLDRQINHNHFIGVYYFKTVIYKPFLKFLNV